MKKKIIFLLHLPPPVHGASTVGLIIKFNFDRKNDFLKFYYSIGTTKYFSERRKISLIKILRFFFQFCKNCYNIIRLKPNLVYFTCSTHGMGFIKDSLYILILKLLKVNFILHFHNKGFHKKSLSQFGIWYHNLILNNSKVILLSHSLLKYYIPLVKKKNCFFLPNGIKDYSRQFTMENKPNFRILFVSNLVESKGVFDLLEICYNLKKVGIDFFLDIVGDEAEISKGKLYEWINSFGLSERVTYYGALYGSDKWGVFSRASLFLYPSREDCFPLVLLEAFSFGLPIVCSNEGALEDIVNHGNDGFIIPEYNPSHYVDKISFLFSDKYILQRFSQEARKSFELKFREEIFINNFAKIVETVI
ncbi:glycosyltransferase family 4 protein [Algoriphagus namhaensis]|uniref:Glycosyltransferase family 4 protein n=1 Tax=Algoriphagus namhaensis TaxID=915353 RepID=A0ABV8AVG8_9BACT